MHPRGAVSLIDSWVIGFGWGILRLLPQLFYVHDLGYLINLKKLESGGNKFGTLVVILVE